MARTPLIAGNWKLNKTRAEAKALARAIRDDAPTGVDLMVAPVATSLVEVCAELAGSRILVAAQNTHFENSGAFTGEISPELILDCGANLCLVGHSERRNLFGEDSELIGKKAAALQAVELTPVICVGEKLEEREAGKTGEVVIEQLDAALRDLSNAVPANEPFIIAYEPVWAIGTGKTASPSDAQPVHAAIRARIAERFDAETAEGTRILYGGSVKPGNAAELLAQPDIDGALVGGASLKADSFLAIAQAALSD